MAVHTRGMKEYQRAVRTLARDSQSDLTRGLKTAAGPVLAEAKTIAPRSRIHRPGYVHLADSLKIGSRRGGVVIYSNKSGAGVVHWGGRHPLFGNRDRWYAQRAQPFVSRAIQHQEGRIVDAVGDAIEAHARKLGWTR
jgi:hypothetical protein